MTIRKVKPIQALFYIVGQVSGAFFGAALLYAVYRSQFNEFDGGQREMTGPNGTADIFFTMPGKGISYWYTFVDQVISTALLMIFIMSITHVRSSGTFAAVFEGQVACLEKESSDLGGGQTIRFRSLDHRHHIGIFRQRRSCSQSGLFDRRVRRCHRNVCSGSRFRSTSVRCVHLRVEQCVRQYR